MSKALRAALIEAVLFLLEHMANKSAEPGDITRQYHAAGLFLQDYATSVRGA